LGADARSESNICVLHASRGDSASPQIRHGRIVAIGSLTAFEPHAGLAAYVTFKAALAMLVRTVALENRDAGVTANVVLPGTMDTPANRKAMP